MLTKNQQKLICQLHQKKYRTLHQMFLAEGKKTVFELLATGMNCQIFVTTDPLLVKIVPKAMLVSAEVMTKLSCLDTPSEVLAVFDIPKKVEIVKQAKILVLDSLKDPGNLGTIIRLCDWFGIKQLVCSLDTVEAYNPKVVQASMGSLGRVNVMYTPLEIFLSKYSSPIFGTFLEGHNIYQTNLPQAGIIVMGSESHGISQKIKNLIHQKITIPQFSEHQKTESLNVANVTAIVLSEWFRPGKI